MTAPRPGERARPFGPDELDGVTELSPEELAAETRLARDLEGIAVRDGIVASADFADRVMAAVGLEPVPAPAVAAGSALRHAALLGFLVSVRDAVRVTFSGGFPVAVRAQALALVLLVVGITAGTGYVAAGAVGLLGDRPSPAPSLEAPTQAPAPTAEPTVTPEATFGTPDPSPSPEPSVSPSEEPSDPAESAGAPEEPGEPPEPGDQAGGGGSGGGGSSGAGSGTETVKPAPKPTPKPTATPRVEPTERPHASETPEPTRTPRPTPRSLPGPTPTPTPTPTPWP